MYGMQTNIKISPGSPVSYQYSKSWRRFGTVIENGEGRALVLWTREIYTGFSTGDFKRESTLNVRTWVAVARLTAGNAA